MQLGRYSIQLAWIGLYMGPLLAGLALVGWGAVLPFMVIFTAWGVIGGRHAALWYAGDRSSYLRLALDVIGQGFMVVLCLALGRGIGGVLGVSPDLGVVVPLTLSLVSVFVLQGIGMQMRATPARSA